MAKQTLLIQIFSFLKISFYFFISYKKLENGFIQLAAGFPTIVFISGKMGVPKDRGWERVLDRNENTTVN